MNYLLGTDIGKSKKRKVESGSVAFQSLCPLQKGHKKVPNRIIHGPTYTLLISILTL